MFNKNSIKTLNDAISFINSARVDTTDDNISKCEKLFKCLNKLWNINPDETDTKSIKKLFDDGLIEGSKKIFCNSIELKSLVDLTPMILNHKTLIKNNYDPSNISPALCKKAQEEHERALSCYKLWLSSPADLKLLKDLLDNIAILTFIVRSNIAHGEKTPRGPYVNKNERDKNVCSKTCPLLELLLDLLFENPSTRLVVYGTLEPSKSNSHVLSDIEGVWLEGEIEGDIELKNGLKYFRWKINRQNHKIKVFESNYLNERFPILDTFEGKAYRRVLVPVSVGSEIKISNIYEEKYD